MKYLIPLLFSALSGCLFFDSTLPLVKVPAKDEVAQRVEDGDTTDYCKIYDWYNDGECDDFCVDPDPDCKLCSEQPKCRNGFSEVQNCVQPLSKPQNSPVEMECEDVSLCGETIHCAKTGPCLDSFQRSCPNGGMVFDSCPVSEECTSDTHTLECSKNTITWYCLTDPSCEPTSCKNGKLEVNFCKLGTTPDCHRVESCEKTIFCTPKKDCPSQRCEDNESLFQTETSCKNEGTQCRQEYCDSIYWCGGTAGCQPPHCDANDAKVDSCGDTETCYEEVGCGKRIICKPNN